MIFRGSPLACILVFKAVGPISPSNKKICTSCFLMRVACPTSHILHLTTLTLEEGYKMVKLLITYIFLSPVSLFLLETNIFFHTYVLLTFK
jgi:hypothetical protein